jgi:hypothetical protein
MNCAPDQALIHVLILMAEDVTSRSHVAPRDLRIPLLHGLRQPSRGFRNNLKTPRDGIIDKIVVTKFRIIKATYEALRQLNIVANVPEPALVMRCVRRHTPHRM